MLYLALLDTLFPGSSVDELLTLHSGWYILQHTSPIDPFQL
jgi:hypothetical protein